MALHDAHDLASVTGKPDALAEAPNDAQNAATTKNGKASRKQRHLPPVAPSICFWIFSRLNEPGVWLGG